MTTWKEEEKKLRSFTYMGFRWGFTGGLIVGIIIGFIIYSEYFC